MTAFALRAHTAPQPASLAYMHLSMLLSFLDIYAHAWHFASDVFSFHRPITHPACASGLGCIPIESPHSLLRSLACICRCCSLVTICQQRQRKPDATARNHAAVVARAPLRHRRTNPPRQCAAVLVPDQTEPSNQPQRQVEAAAQGVVPTPGRVVLSRPTPHGVIPHPHHLLDRQPQGSQVPLSDSRVCSTYFTRWASPQHAHAVQPVISHTIVMFPMPIERLNACPKQ